VLLSLAPAGSLLVASGFWQSVMSPALVTAQVPPGFPAASGLTPVLELAAALAAADALALGFGDALALGCGDALALGLGVTPAWASPVSMRVLAAVMTTRAGQRPMPGHRLHFFIVWTSSADPDITTATRCRGRCGLRPVHHAMTTMSEIFIVYFYSSLHVRQG
jgi:hypothetical protein